MSIARWPVTLLFSLVAGAAAADEWVLSQAPSPVAAGSPVVETVWTGERPPAGAYDRIRVHRFGSPTPAKAALLYLPGTNMNGSVALVDERYNLWLYLAARGVEVYTLDYRTHTVPPSGVEDLAFMREWTLAAFVDDAAAAARLAREQSGGLPLFVAGFSRGVTLAYALAGAVEELAGLAALDGYFKSHAGDSDYDRREARERLAASAGWARDVAAGMGWEPRHRLMAEVIEDPAGPPSRDGFSSIGEQLARILYDAWRPGGLANPVEGYSRPEILARLLDGYDRYYPALHDIEGASISDYPDDPSTALDDHWGEMRLPVFYVGATGMGPTWVLDGLYSAVESGSPDVEIRVLEGHGHLDVLVGETSAEEVFAPLLGWLAAKSPSE